MTRRSSAGGGGEAAVGVVRPGEVVGGVVAGRRRRTGAVGVVVGGWGAHDEPFFGTPIWRVRSCTSSNNLMLVCVVKHYLFSTQDDNRN